MVDFSKVMVHCSATPDVESGWASRVGADEIDQWHKDRGWSGIGYHYVIKRDGTIEAGRSLSKSGAHTRGMNKHPGICWIGTRRPTMAQLEAFCSLHDLLSKKYNVDAFDYEPHYKYANKECPGFPIEMLRFILHMHETGK